MQTSTKAVLYGTPIGALGGLIGLGGAEFRLPVLKAAFHRPTRQAVALNLAVSLLTLLASLAIRMSVAWPAGLVAWLPVLGSLVAGSMVGAYVGAAHAGRIPVDRLEQWIVLLLVVIGLALIAEGIFPLRSVGIPDALVVRVPAAIGFGLGIGIISSLLGVAGGEVIIPTLVLAFGADIKTAGTLSVMISLPTVSVGIWRHARRVRYEVGDLRGLVLPMGLGSIAGALLGGYLVPRCGSQDGAGHPPHRLRRADLSANPRLIRTATTSLWVTGGVALPRGAAASSCSSRRSDRQPPGGDADRLRATLPRSRMVTPSRRRGVGSIVGARARRNQMPEGPTPRWLSVGGRRPAGSAERRCAAR